jgi:hypothetical protein
MSVVNSEWVNPLMKKFKIPFLPEPQNSAWTFHACGPHKLFRVQVLDPEDQNHQLSKPERLASAHGHALINVKDKPDIRWLKSFGRHSDIPMFRQTFAQVLGRKRGGIILPDLY